MKVFISWSGERSRAIALALHGWLPTIIQTVKPWISEEDITKGARWAAELTKELEQTSVGIICLTPENLHAPWLIFEAGALSKTQQSTYICTLLYEIEYTDFQGPLAQFQYTRAEEDDMKRLVHDINRLQGEEAFSEKQIDTAFVRGWDDFYCQLKSIPSVQEKRNVALSDTAMVKEILLLVREQARDNSNNSSENRPTGPSFPGAQDMSPEDLKLLGDMIQSLYFERQSLKREIEKLRTDESYAQDWLRTLQGKYRSHDWPAKPLLPRVRENEPGD
jgi:TIR domain